MKRPNSNAAEPTPGRWFQYARHLWGFIDAGYLERLTPAAVYAWLVLFRHADADTLTCDPSLARIAELAGKHPTTAADGTAELERGGLLRRKRGGGRRRTRYKLKPLAKPLKGVNAKAAPVKPGKQLSAGRYTNRYQRTDAIEQQQAAAAGEHGEQAEARPEGDPIRAALAAAGIGEPVRTELARHPTITPELIAREAGSGRTRGKGRGAIVQNIRAALDAQQAQAEQARQQARTMEAEARRRALDDLQAIPEGLLAELIRQANERRGRECPEDWRESAEWVQAVRYAWLEHREREHHARNGRPAGKVKPVDLPSGK